MKALVNKYIIVILACIFIGLIIFYSSTAIIEGIVSNSLTEIASQGTLLVTKDLEAHMNILLTISQSDSISRSDIDLSERVTSLKNYTGIDKFLRLSISDHNGDVFTTDGARLNIKDREYYIQAVSGRNYVSDPIASRVDGSKVIVFAVPLVYEGQITGILSATYSVYELSEIINSIKYGSEGYAFILDSEGNVIAHKDIRYVDGDINHIEKARTDKTLKRLETLEKKMISGDSGAGDYYLNGNEWYMGFSPINGTSWSLAITSTKDEVFSDIKNLLTLLILLIGSIMLSAFIVNTYLIYLRKRVNRHIKTSQNVMDIAKMLVISFSEDGLISSFNCYAEEKTGYIKEDVVGKKNIFDLVDEKSRKILKEILSLKELYPNRSFELALVGLSGEKLYVLFNLNRFDNLFAKPDSPGDIEIIGFDLTERIKAEKELNEKHDELSQVYEELSASQDELHSQFERIYQLAFYDSLTRLPNRSLFLQHLADVLSGKPEESISVFIIDIDNFKYINDTFGFHFGNIILKSIADRLLKLSEQRFFIARLNGDEFSAIIEQPVYNEAELAQLAEWIFDMLETPFMVEKIKLNLSVSIGISTNLEHETQADTLLGYADVAMNKAKERGKNCYVFFDKSMTKEISDKLIMTNCLRDAISNNEFKMFYQPQYDAFSQKIISFEGLLRWNNPQLGNVPPSSFIKIAEEAGLIQSIGLWVLKEGCIFARQINEKYDGDFIVSINVSPLQMCQDNFVNQVQRVIQETNVNPIHIGIEITENAMIEAFDSCLEKLEALNRMGIRIYLDDFGTGYSSLNYLSKLPISYIKLDRSFIKELASDKKVKQLTETIISLAHKIGMGTVAEGVETYEQLDILCQSGCDMVQGYLFSKPVPEEFTVNMLSKKLYKNSVSG